VAPKELLRTEAACCSRSLTEASPMSMIPQTQRDQLKLVIGIIAVALAVVYYLYPYSAANEQLALDTERVESLEAANRTAQKEFAAGSVETLRTEAAEQRAALVAMRRLVPTNNEVPALLEEVSTAARRAGLDVGTFTPEPVIQGEKFETHRYKVTIIGGYHEIGGFLANVGSLPRIVAPVHFALTPSNGGATDAAPNAPFAQRERTGLEATVTLQTYVERTAPAPTRVASASAETNP
jgi:type IV pilus assembly protein PilO